jgi:hypothetical protein
MTKITVYSPPGQQGELIRREAQQVLKKIGVPGKVEVTTNEFECARAGVMFTPAISINGKLVTNGWVPDAGEFERLFKVHLN